METATAKPRISRISIGRLCNLGNYEHIRYEVTVELPEGTDAAKTLTYVETALNSMCEKAPNSIWNVKRAQERLANQQAEPLDDEERAHYQRIVQAHEDWLATHQEARRMLSDFALMETFTDQKLADDEEIAGIG